MAEAIPGERHVVPMGGVGRTATMSEETLKKIPAGQAAIGMYVVRADGSWIGHDLWRSRFLIQDADELAAVRGCGAAHVWIDLARGRDLAGADGTQGGSVSGPPAPAAAPAVAAGAAPTAPVPAAPASAAPPTAPGVADTASRVPGAVRTAPAATSVADELPRAAKLLENVKERVRSTLVRAQAGIPPDIEECRTVVAPMVESVMRNASALTSLIRLRNRDDYSYMHSVSVSVLMIMLARELRMDESACHEAGLAGLLHDVGKALIPAEILNKPGRLTDEEFAVVRTHPRRGYDLLREAGLSQQAALDVCLHHHERVDGTGYPDRLPPDQLSRWARMGAICDVFDAISSERAYKKPWDPAHSLAQMASWQGQFDRTMLAAFVKSMGVYPVSSLVRLSSSRLGVVTEARSDRPRQPLVKVFYCLRRREPVKTYLVDTAAPGTADTIVAVEPRENWASLDLGRLLAVA